MLHSRFPLIANVVAIGRFPSGLERKTRKSQRSVTRTLRISCTSVQRCSRLLLLLLLVEC